ncbi:MAG: S9 family peptidase [Paludibacter sp.]|nr:S9 family peptidase [Paludibacter sp.]
MRRLKVILILSLSFCFAQADLLYDITDGKYRPASFDSPRSMVDGENYTMLVKNKAVVKYNYKTGNTVDTLFSLSQIKNCPIKNISGYELSPNEMRLLVYTNVKYRYRRTFTADYYIFDLKRKELQPLSDNGGAEEVPLFSPDSRYIAFARKNNLYMKKLDFNTEIAITKDGEAGKIINGTPDWVYEEEFELTRFFAWSPDSKLLAFIKFDESKIPEFAFQTYDSELQGEDINLYPGFKKFKYPKAGQENSKVTVCIYDDFNKTTRPIQLPDTENDFYIPRIKWTTQPDQLAIFKLNRNQNRLDMLMANARSTTAKLILRQEDKRYVDYENIDYTTFTSDNQYFFTLSEQDGYRHIYQYRMNGTLYKQITKGKWEVTDFYGYDEKKKIVYYQSAETSPLQRDVFSLDSKGKKTRLTNGKGVHKAYFNSTFTCFADKASSLEHPDIVTLRTQNGIQVREMQNNKNLEEKFQALQLPKKEFFSFTTSENVKLNGWMLKPVNFDNSKKYPVLQVQYSGPNTQEVLDQWSIGWEYYLAQNGYIVVCVDGRGTGGRGADFCKCTYEQMGILEARDQVEVAKFMGRQSFVDKDRIGIWGWSYGGSMTLWSMSTGEKIFKTGIAVAPVTDWRLYDSAYTERFMRRPQENFDGYNKTSAIGMADKLNGKLLIIHGTADDNVHFQNTMLYVSRLIELNKQFDMQVYPDKNHSLLGKQTRRHLYTKMSEYLFNNL